MRSVVTCFSRTGNTRKVAEAIAQALPGAGPVSRGSPDSRDFADGQPDEARLAAARSFAEHVAADAGAGALSATAPAR